MRMLGGMCTKMKEHERAVRWFTMGAEAGFPDAMCCLGCSLDTGKGVAAPGSTAAAGWYQRAADASNGMAAHNLHVMYTPGRGRLGRYCLPRHSSTF
jgi:TPR repeat protein